MTMDEVAVLTGYWLDHPPAHLLLGGRRVKTVAPDNELARLLGANPNSPATQPMRLHE